MDWGQTDGWRERERERERFGPHMCRLIFLLGQNTTSHVTLSDGVTPIVFLTRFVRQGCPRSPLLSVIVTHSFFVMLSNRAVSGDIVGLHLPSSGQLVA